MAMNRRYILPALFLLLPLLVTACSSPQTFDVTVTNLTPDTLQVFITKLNPPYEKDREPPEQQLILRDQVTAYPLPPDQSGHIIVKMDVGGGNIAMLQIYRAPDTQRVLGMSRGNPGRADYPIDPGYTNVAFKVNNSGMLVGAPFNADLKPPPTTGK